MTIHMGCNAWWLTVDVWKQTIHWLWSVMSQGASPLSPPPFPDNRALSVFPNDDKHRRRHWTQGRREGGGQGGHAPPPEIPMLKNKFFLLTHYCNGC